MSTPKRKAANVADKENFAGRPKRTKKSQTKEEPSEQNDDPIPDSGTSRILGVSSKPGLIMNQVISPEVKPSTSKSLSAKGKKPKANPNTKSEEDFKTLISCLNKTTASGDFCVEGVASELPNAIGLEVEKFGKVHFPLEEARAKELIKVCTLAPFGKNELTLYDKKVRDSYQLDPSQVTINSRNWDTKLNQLVKRVGVALGCQDEIEAKLYKVLVYEKGGHFLKHRDTEKEKNMFGTLIIQPPSTHTGGELVVYENNDRSQRVVDFGQQSGKSKSCVHFAAHYADLEHELREVTSGYRLALVYSLCWANGNGTNHVTSYSVCDKMLSSFESLIASPYQLGILLEYQYTPRSMQQLGIKALKGIDQDRFQMLATVNSRLSKENQLSFYLCHVNLIIDSYDVTGYETPSGYISPTYPYEWEENERKLEITNWYDVSGKTVFNSSRFELDHFTKVFNLGANTSEPVDLKNEKAWGKHTSEKLGGWAGNEGVTKTTTYSKYLLVVWPKRFEIETLVKMDVKLAIQGLYESVVNKKHTLDESKQREFAAIMDILSKDSSDNDSDDDWKKIRLGEAHTVAMVELLTIFSEIHYVNMFMERKEIKMNEYIATKFADLVVRFGEEKMKKHLKKLIVSNEENFFPICHFILQLRDHGLKELATSYFKSCVLSQLKDKKKLNYIVQSYALCWSSHRMFLFNDDYESEPTERCYKGPNVDNKHPLIILARCFNAYPNETAPFIGPIREEITALLEENQHMSLKSPLEAFFKEKDPSLKNSPLVRGILEDRQSVLSEKVKNKQAFSWRMPKAKIEGHPKFEEFLKSDRAEMEYELKDSSDISSFVYSYNSSWMQNNYSIVVTKKSAKVVKIKKTKKWFNDQAEKSKDHSLELMSIISFDMVLK